MPDVDLAPMSEAELLALRGRITVELERRQTLAAAPALIEQAAAQYRAATGRKDGDAWVQPTGAHDAYRVGAIVTHSGKSWRNVVASNVWAPGVAGWREEVAAGEVAPWVQPLGAVDAYKIGDRVKHAGVVYKSKVNGNGWAPTVTTAWEPEVVTPPASIEWAVGKAYSVMQAVTYQGKRYLCKQPHTSQAGWDPVSVPALWQLDTLSGTTSK